jgi:hypothetical protein
MGVMSGMGTLADERIKKVLAQEARDVPARVSPGTAITGFKQPVLTLSRGRVKKVAEIQEKFRALWETSVLSFNSTIFKSI